MKYLYSLLWLCTVFFFSCNGGLPDAEETEGEIEIFPDYKGVAVPCNIAPLNFKLKEPCEAIALFSGKDQQIRVNSDNGSFQIPEKKWRRLLDASVGGNLTVGIYICKDNRWFRIIRKTKSSSFKNEKSKKEVDVTITVGNKDIV